MLQDFEQIGLFQLSVGQVVANLAVALACGFLISLIYRKTYRGPGYSVAFVNSMVLLSMITAVVLMVIGNNLARAFGLVGAMSIIRFRTAVKETQDIVFIFFSLAIGMAAGVGYHLIAITGTIFIGLVMMLFANSGVTTTGQKEYLLQFSFSPNGEEDTPAYLDTIKKYCRGHKVINVKSLGDGDLLELSYYVRLKDVSQNSRFIRELGNVYGVQHINLFFDEEDL